MYPYARVRAYENAYPHPRKRADARGAAHCKRTRR